MGLSRYGGNSAATSPQASNKPVSVTVSGGGSSNFVDGETPAGTIDGVNDTFTLTESPSPAASLQLYRNGILQAPGGSDFTLTGDTIVFEAASIPQTGDSLDAFFRY